MLWLLPGLPTCAKKPPHDNDRCDDDPGDDEYLWVHCRLTVELSGARADV
jgi:hypothetical protein